MVSTMAIAETTTTSWSASASRIKGRMCSYRPTVFCRLSMTTHESHAICWVGLVVTPQPFHVVGRVDARRDVDGSHRVERSRPVRQPANLPYVYGSWAVGSV